MPIERALTVVAIDDEPLALRRVTMAIDAIEGVELIGTARSGKAGLEMLKELRPDVLLLDINMAELDGFDVMSALDEDGPLVIFVTAFHEYAVRAFDVKAVDYLLKPVEFDRLRRSLESAQARLSDRAAADQVEELKEVVNAIRAQAPGPQKKRYETEIWAPWAGTFERLPIADIDWIEAEGDYVLIHARGKTHLIRDTISGMEARLDPDLFTRVHRSVLVYHKKVERIERPGNGRYVLTLAGGEKVPVGRNYVKLVRSWIVTPSSADEGSEAGGKA